MPASRAILERLIGFPSLAGTPNHAIADWIAAYLADAGAEVARLPNADASRMGLVARIGPAVAGGVILSAHMDVVPVAGQAWSRDPFALHAEGGRLYGRGTADMKGFLAAALHAARAAGQGTLSRPLILVLSYDEEIGCRGIAEMAPRLGPHLHAPALALVGEPTSMRIVTGHKGKIALDAVCTGEAGHSARAPLHLNALHLGADFLGLLRAVQGRIAAAGPRVAGYEVPHATVHAGTMRGGAALNIVPERAEIGFEIRHTAAEDPDAILAEIRAGAEAIVAAARHPAAAITLTERARYPGLETAPDSGAVAAIRAVLPAGTALARVDYGTEAGFFAALGCPAVVCGPGSMTEAHRADEFLTEAQLAACEAMLGRLVATLR
ncbi:MAG: acetylornithine deacetylase [Gemmobacter sp.]